MNQAIFSQVNEYASMTTWLMRIIVILFSAGLFLTIPLNMGTEGAFCASGRIVNTKYFRLAFAVQYVPYRRQLKIAVKGRDMRHA